MTQSKTNLCQNWASCLLELKELSQNVVSWLSEFKKPLILWGCANLFFAFQFVLRMSAGILREEIMQKFAIDAVAFGTLAGYYYLGYAGMQIPIGIMLDRFNFKIVTFCCILISSVGTLMFVISTNWHYIFIGRFMIGVGSAVGVLAIIKIISTFFPKNTHPFLIGLMFTFGLSGAVFGTAPMKILFNNFGYNNTFYFLVFTGLAMGVCILMNDTKNLKNYNTQPDSIVVQSQNMSIVSLLSNKTILIIGISGGLMVGALEGYADVWSMTFFKQIYNMSDTQSNIVTSFVFIGMCFGGPILAVLVKILRSINLIIIISGMLMIVIFIILFYASHLSYLESMLLMFVLGILCCYQGPVFNLVSNITGQKSAALAVSIVNCINMAFGYLFHKLISILIQENWNGAMSECNLPIYSKETFIISLSVIPAFTFIGMLGFIYVWRAKRI